MLAFSNDYYGFIFRVTQSVELFCTYLSKPKSPKEEQKKYNKAEKRDATQSYKKYNYKKKNK